jgi:hypothetical protein
LIAEQGSSLANPKQAEIPLSEHFQHGVLMSTINSSHAITPFSTNSLTSISCLHYNQSAGLIGSDEWINWGD